MQRKSPGGSEDESVFSGPPWPTAYSQACRENLPGVVWRHHVSIKGLLAYELRQEIESGTSGSGVRGKDSGIESGTKRFTREL